MLPLIPVLVLTAYLFGGEIGLVAIAILLPSLLAVANSLRQPLATGHVRDPLTDLIMRDGLIDWVERALPRAAGQGCQVAVMSITIDDLDTLEARFGRAMHDTVILEAVQRMRALLRDDDIVARLGQAIAIGMDNVRMPENESLTQMAERIKHAFEEPFCDGPTRTYCTVSIGIAAESHVRSSSGANIVAGAQRASELAIVSGAGSVRLYSGGLSSEEAMHRNTARELNNALETSEIFAWFQPQVRIADGKVIGFEALARWDHPDRGLVSPASFLPDLERAGLSQRLAEVILKQSLMALNVWDAAGYDVPSVSVNFSSEELRNPRLPDYVRWELDRHEIAPERLVVEVLESVVSETGEDAITRTLHALSRIGCHIDLDDFGTGFTSFLNIRRFDVDRIKIDRSLVNKIDTDEAQHSMFAALLAFGNKLGIETLAEGVETEEEARVLADLGCRDMQGYAISRPLPLGESMLWLEEKGEFKIPDSKSDIRDSA
jgi:diguanylate cyclase (GGDEF)-like protein